MVSLKMKRKHLAALRLEMQDILIAVFSHLALSLVDEA